MGHVSMMSHYLVGVVRPARPPHDGPVKRGFLTSFFWEGNICFFGLNLIVRKEDYITSAQTCEYSHLSPCREFRSEIHLSPPGDRDGSPDKRLPSFRFP